MVSILPSSVRTEAILALEKITERLSDIDLSPLAVYNFDTVPESALDDLADQFNVLGLRGWALAETPLAKRELLKAAIELHRFAGTRFAIRRALESLGYEVVAIDENGGLRYDGTWAYDGSRTYTSDFAGTFSVTIGETPTPPTLERVQLIISLINEWKNLRSRLRDLRQYNRSLISNPMVYDGQWRYNGEQVYDGSLDLGGDLGDNA